MGDVFKAESPVFGAPNHAVTDCLLHLKPDCYSQDKPLASPEDRGLSGLLTLAVGWAPS